MPLESTDDRRRSMELRDSKKETKLKYRLLRRAPDTRAPSSNQESGVRFETCFESILYSDYKPLSC